jgi:hypothetical protein
MILKLKNLKEIKNEVKVIKICYSMEKLEKVLNTVLITINRF